MIGQVSSLRARLAEGAPLVGTFLKLPSSDAAGVLAGAGFDFLLVDREHSQLSDGEARALVRAAAALGVPSLVRVPALERGEVNRLLEAGAAGIQLSSVRSAAEARALVDACRYAPGGRRSISLAHAGADYGRRPLAEYLDRVSGDGAPLAVAQLETATTDDPLGEIAAAGLDAVFIGTTDLLVDLGLDRDATAGRAAEIAAAAGAAGVPWGAFAADADAAARLVEQGARFVALGSDLALLAAAAAAALAGARGAPA